MSFKELVLQEEFRAAAAYGESPKSLWQTLFENNSPVMTLWFMAMLVNLAVLIWVI